MNRYQDEFAADYNRQRIKDEFKQIRLEQLALKSQVYKPGRFARMMFNFANWMVSTVKQLRKRYEIPAVDSSRSLLSGQDPCTKAMGEPGSRTSYRADSRER